MFTETEVTLVKGSQNVNKYRENILSKYLEIINAFQSSLLDLWSSSMVVAMKSNLG